MRFVPCFDFFPADEQNSVRSSGMVHPAFRSKECHRALQNLLGACIRDRTDVFTVQLPDILCLGTSGMTKMPFLRLLRVGSFTSKSTLPILHRETHLLSTHLLRMVFGLTLSRGNLKGARWILSSSKSTGCVPAPTRHTSTPVKPNSTSHLINAVSHCFTNGRFGTHLRYGLFSPCTASIIVHSPFLNDT